VKKIRACFIFFLFLNFIGCAHFSTKDKWSCRLRIILVESTNPAHSWDQYILSDLEKQIEFLQVSYQDTNLEFDILPYEKIRSNALYDSTIVDYLLMQQIANWRYFLRGELSVFYVNSVDIQIAFKQENAAAISSPPRLPFGFQQGILMDRHVSPDTLAHEIGHMFGLPHAWEQHNKFYDVKTTGSSDGYSDPCNVMNYANFRTGDCTHKYFSKTQIKEINSWILSPQRMLCIYKGKLKHKIE